MSSTPPPLPPFHGIAAKFAVVMGILVRAIKQRHCVDFPWDRVSVVHRRVHRFGVRFARLIERVRAGALRGPRPSRAGKEGAGQVDAGREAAEDPVAGLPRGKRWLAELLRPVAPGVGALLSTLVELDPEMRALFEAAPRQTGRLLRPLCRALGVAMPAWLQLPARARRVRVRARRAVETAAAVEEDAAPVVLGVSGLRKVGLASMRIGPWVRAHRAEVRALRLAARSEGGGAKTAG